MKTIKLICLLAGFSIHLITHGQTVPNEEDWSRLPPAVNPGNQTTPPSDAIVLFDGTSFHEWVDAEGKVPGWKIENGTMQIVPGSGSIFSKSAFGDVQLHVEWMIPEQEYGHGNSGIYLQGKYEVQIFNSNNNDSEIYYNGQTGSLYKQYAPLVNASRPRGQWDTFDIIYTAPRFGDQGELISPAMFTVFHNGILIQYNATLKGTTTHEKTTAYEPHPLKQPIMIQDHGDRVIFRNIWIREL
jgi:hypothetical protein